MRRIKEQLVVVEFWDHYQTTGQDMRLIKCKVPGFLVGEDEKAVYLVYWLCDDEIDNPNTEAFGLLKHNSMKINKAQILKTTYKLTKGKKS